MTTALERSKALPPDPTMPSLQEELNRKSLDAIQRIIEDYDDGMITALELKTATRALFDAVAGLVDRGIIDIMSEVAKLRIEGKPVVVRRFVHENKLAVIERSLLDPSVVSTAYETNPGAHFSHRERSFNDELHPHRHAQDYFNGVCDKLIEKGFEEV